MYNAGSCFPPYIPSHTLIFTHCISHHLPHLLSLLLVLLFPTTNRVIRCCLVFHSTWSPWTRVSQKRAAIHACICVLYMYICIYIYGWNNSESVRTIIWRWQRVMDAGQTVHSTPLSVPPVSILLDWSTLRRVSLHHVPAVFI